jgi:hypothetical protein
MKTYKEIIGEAKASGESPRRDKEFKDKHVIQKINHPVAGDDQFGAPNIKKDKTKHASHHDGEDALVYEEVKELDELSQDTLWKYHAKAGADLLKKREKLDKGTLTSKEYKQGRNRAAGLNRAADKMHEEMSDAEMKKREDLVKGMKKNKADFQKRYGDRWKSVMYATATKNAMKESVEQIDELSKKTLGSYVKKASYDAANRAAEFGAKGKGKDFSKSMDRLRNVKKAADKLTKEEVEQLDELSPNALHSYIKKAAGNMAGNAAVAAAQASSSMKKSSPDVKRKIKNRMQGITGASGRLADKANMGEEYMDEAFKAGSMKLKDGSSISVTSEQASTLNALFTELNSSNQKKMQERLMSSTDNFNEILAFAKAAL